MTLIPYCWPADLLIIGGTTKVQTSVLYAPNFEHKALRSVTLDLKRGSVNPAVWSGCVPEGIWEAPLLFEEFQHPGTNQMLGILCIYPSFAHTCLPYCFSPYRPVVISCYNILARCLANNISCLRVSSPHPLHASMKLKNHVLGHDDALESTCNSRCQGRAISIKNI